jgi:rhomboid family GlyGly-CTERM serine protease
MAWLSMAVPVVLLQACGTPVRLALRFERDAILAGQVWRLLTAHMVHLGWTHCMLNLAGLGLCLLVAPDLFRSAGALWRRFALLALGVGVLMLVLPIAVQSYVGLSGVLYGLFVLGLWPQARSNWIAALCLGFVLGRMLWQWMAGPSIAEELMIGGNIVAQAHMYGVLVALAMLAVAHAVLTFRHRPDPRPPAA